MGELGRFMTKVTTAEEASYSRVEGIVLARLMNKQSLTWAYNSLVKDHEPEEIRSVFQENWDHFSKLNRPALFELASKLGLSEQ